MAPGRILVIAPSIDFRRSLAFALEAEGHEVTAERLIVADDDGDDYDCVVLDHQAAQEHRELALALCGRAHRVLLLGDGPAWLEAIVACTVPTPLRDDTLLRAVAEVLAAPATHP